MKNHELIPAFTHSARFADAHFGKSGIDSDAEGQIDIYEYGPWHHPCNDSSICARYVIGQSPLGYHWDTEFVTGVKNPASLRDIEQRHHNKQAHDFHWSPPSAFVDLAIKHARRCITIQARTIHLDKSTKIKITLEPGRISYADIDKIALHKRLAYSVEKHDLQRLALFNGYMSWSEYENGTLEFHSA